MAPVFEAALHSLKGCRHVIDIRNAGLMGAVELAPREGQPTQRAMDVFRRCYDAGVLVRTTGDTIALTPPLIVSEKRDRADHRHAARRHPGRGLNGAMQQQARKARASRRRSRTGSAGAPCPAAAGTARCSIRRPAR